MSLSASSATSPSSSTKLLEDEQHFKTHFSSLAMTHFLAKEMQRLFGEILSLHRPDFIAEAAQAD